MAVEVESLFEAGSPLARRLAAESPFASADALIARARTLLDELDEEEKAATLAAHPRIGERADRLSKASRQEQGEDALPELDALNAEYERRFGFRFVTFVNRRSKAAVAEELRRRLENLRDQELQAGLIAVVEIAADRLGSLR